MCNELGGILTTQFAMIGRSVRARPLDDIGRILRLRLGMERKQTDRAET